MAMVMIMHLSSVTPLTTLCGDTNHATVEPSHVDEGMHTENCVLYLVLRVKTLGRDFQGNFPY